MEVTQRVPFLTQSKTKDNLGSRPTPSRGRRHPICYRTLLYVASIVVVLILFSLTYRLFDLYVFPSPKLDVTQLEVKKCPGCAGQSICPAFFRGDVRLSGIYRNLLANRIVHQPVSGLEGSMGLYEFEKPVRLRRLGSPSEPRLVDEAVCRRGLHQGYEDAGPLARARLQCIPHLAIWRWRPTNWEQRSDSQTVPHDPVDLPLERRMIVAPSFHPIPTNESAETDSSAEQAWAQSVMPKAFAPATRCASDRMFQLLQARFRERTSFGAETRWTRFDELMFLFNLAIDPQSVITQAFPRTEHWPFPTHLGACGRWVVQAQHGVPLNRFCGSPLWLRLRILHNLLALPDRLERPPVAPNHATLLTHPVDPHADLTTGYAVYLNAFNLGDTFLVDPSTYEVTVTDLRQAIIVDTQTLINFNFSESNITEFVVPQGANKHVMHGWESHRCLGDTERLGDAGGSTPSCVRRDHADALCNHPRSDHNIWVMCVSLVYATDMEIGDTPCTDFLHGFPAVSFQFLNQCVNQPELRRASFTQLRSLVANLIDTHPVPRGLQVYP